MPLLRTLPQSDHRSICRHCSHSYNDTVIGQTTAPIDTMLAFTQETNGANLQADASVYELETKNGIPVDFHLSGAMTNKLIATGATPATPFTLKISDMFAAMPYENSLVVIGYEWTPTQGGPGTGVPELLLLQVCSRLWWLFLLHHLHDRYGLWEQDHIQ